MRGPTHFASDVTNILAMLLAIYVRREMVFAKRYLNGLILMGPSRILTDVFASREKFERKENAVTFVAHLMHNGIPPCSNILFLLIFHFYSLLIEYIFFTGESIHVITDK